MSFRRSAIGFHRSSALRVAMLAAAVLLLAPAVSGPASPFPVRALAAQETGLPVGSKAPGALVETLDGRPFDLGQYVGKTPLLIQFWATWCPNCKQLQPALTAASKKYAGKIKLVGIAVSVNQSPERVKLYIEKYRVPLEMYFDRKGNAADAYDAAATSYVVVIDRSGTVVYTGLGGEQDVEAAIAKGLGSRE